MKDAPSRFNAPFRIFLLVSVLAGLGVVMVYSASASYASNQGRVYTAVKIRNQLADQELAENPDYAVASPEKRREMRAEARRRAKPRANQIAAETFEDDHDYHDPRYALKQVFWVLLGFAGMFLTYRIDYHRLKSWGPWGLIASLALLLLVFVPGVGKAINQDQRWIGIAGFTFQPSELAKLALVVYMARMLTDHHDRIRSFLHGVLPALAITALFVVAIVLEPDIGGAAVLTAIVFLMWFIGGMRVVHLAGLAGATIPAFVAVVLCFPDRVARVLAFLNPTGDALSGAYYQLLHSLIAVGSGGLTGVGLGASMQKHFVTEQFSDFIFAIVAEELGLLGAASIILLYFLLMWEGWRVALRAPDFYGALLASGVTLMLMINVLLNLMIVLGLAPTKGLVLPLLSYGGSNVLVTMTGLGILMNVAKYVERQKAMAPDGRSRRSRAERSAKKKRRGARRPRFKHGWT